MAFSQAALGSVYACVHARQTSGYSTANAPPLCPIMAQNTLALNNTYVSPGARLKTTRGDQTGDEKGPEDGKRLRSHHSEGNS